jgi:hypothetical protein
VRVVCYLVLLIHYILQYTRFRISCNRKITPNWQKLEGPARLRTTSISFRRLLACQSRLLACVLLAPPRNAGRVNVGPTLRHPGGYKYPPRPPDHHREAKPTTSNFVLIPPPLRNSRCLHLLLHHRSSGRPRCVRRGGEPNLCVEVSLKVVFSSRLS